jgi:hypothetical protein
VDTTGGDDDHLHRSAVCYPHGQGPINNSISFDARLSNPLNLLIAKKGRARGLDRGGQSRGSSRLTPRLGSTSFGNRVLDESADPIAMLVTLRGA